MGEAPVGRDRVAILHDGVAYQFDGGELKVSSSVLCRVCGLKERAVLEAWGGELGELGPLEPAGDGRGVRLDRFQVEHLGAILERVDAAFVSILEVLRAHADDHLRVDGRRLAAVVPPDEVSRGKRSGSPGVGPGVGRGAVPAGRAGRLRVRHGRLAGWMSVSERTLLAAVARFKRELEPHGVMERFEADALGATVLGVYLAEIQASLLVEAMGLGGPERVAELFEERIAFGLDLEARAARDAANHEARVAQARARPTCERVLADIVGGAGAMTPAGERMAMACAEGAAGLGEAAGEMAAACDWLTTGGAAMNKVAHSRSRDLRGMLPRNSGQLIVPHAILNAQNRGSATGSQSTATSR